VNKEARWEAFSEFRGLLLSFEMKCDQFKQSQSSIIELLEKSKLYKMSMELYAKSIP
jgi:hypothetical protein